MGIFDKLFDDVGYSLKRMARVLFVLFELAVFAGGVTAWALIGAALSLLDMGFVGFFTFLAILLFGTILNVIYSRALYGLGEAAEQARAAYSAVMVAQNKIEGNAAALETLQKKVDRLLQEKDDIEEKKSEETRTVWAYPIYVDRDHVACSVCGCKQPGNRRICFECGAHFLNETIRYS